MKQDELISHYTWLKMNLDFELYDKLVEAYEEDGMAPGAAHRATAARLMVPNRLVQKSDGGSVTNVDFTVQ